jgi:cation diffusion facilitator family transporter
MAERRWSRICHYAAQVSTEGGTRAILAALAANLGIAITKFIAYLLTGSSSMLAESVHSVADSGNQALLLLGGRRAQKQATPQHPFGYGRERYFWAFVVSIVLFTVGGLFALYEAWHKFQDPEPIEGGWWWVPIAVLLVSIVLESFSFRTAIRESNHVRGRRPWAQFIRSAKAPELPVVLLEDFAALIGLIFALFGVGLTLLTHNGVWDAVGTALIGILLVIVAITLSVEMKSLLLGEAGSPENVRQIEEAVAGSDGVDRIIHMRTLHVGPEELLVAAKVAVTTTDTADEIADAINRAELAARQAVPSLTLLMYIEPDLDRGTTERPAWDRGTANA